MSTEALFARLRLASIPGEDGSLELRIIGLPVEMFAVAACQNLRQRQAAERVPSIGNVDKMQRARSSLDGNRRGVMGLVVSILESVRILLRR